MSCKSVLSNSIKSNCDGTQWIKAQSVETNVKLAGEEAKDRLYEPKHKKKLFRVLTVVAYVFSVSLAAIMLSLYYMFLWNPNTRIKITADQAKARLECHGQFQSLKQPKIEDFPNTLDITTESDSWTSTDNPGVYAMPASSLEESILLRKLVSQYFTNSNISDVFE